MKKWVRISVVLFFGGALAGGSSSAIRAQAKAAEDRPPKLDFTTHTLKNGLKVVLLEEHAVPAINLQIWYHVGSKDEAPEGPASRICSSI